MEHGKEKGEKEGERGGGRERERGREGEREGERGGGRGERRKNEGKGRLACLYDWFVVLSSKFVNPNIHVHHVCLFVAGPTTATRCSGTATTTPVYILRGFRRSTTSPKEVKCTTGWRKTWPASIARWLPGSFSVVTDRCTAVEPARRTCKDLVRHVMWIKNKLTIHTWNNQAGGENELGGPAYIYLPR